MLLATSLSVYAQGKVEASDTFLLGSWKGTSLCQVKPSPCHDEVVVYHITTDSTKGLYNIRMNKIVSGEEEFMADIPATFEAKTHKLVGTMKGYPAWQFRVSGRKLAGKLFLQDGTIYRLIEVEKQ